MSLISFKNFSAPFENKLHVGAILLVAILVLVARYSGASLGGAHTSDTSRSRQTESDAVNSEIRQFLETREGAPAVPSDPSRAPRGDDFLNALMKNETAKKTAQKKAEPADGGLNDIKRELGLE